MRQANLSLYFALICEGEWTMISGLPLLLRLRKLRCAVSPTVESLLPAAILRKLYPAKCDSLSGYNLLYKEKKQAIV
jgi:hypothetical protein